MALDWIHPVSSYIETLIVFNDDQAVQVLTVEQIDALLDSDMGLPDLRGQLRVVYVQANHDWLIKAMVCCTLSFDEDGYCETDRFLPLQRLCDSAGPGPDFGAGRIRLACRSQCPISGYKVDLWDPSTKTFSAVTQALKECQDSLLDSGADKHNDESDVDVIKRTLRNEEAANRNQVQQLQQALEQQTMLSERLTAQVLQLTEQRSSLHEHELRMQNERLNMKVREQQVLLEKLRAQSTPSSNADVDELDYEANDSVVKRMQENEVMSVAYHPGAGHINLHPHQLFEYLDDPIAYAAHQVSLSKGDYLTWLKHHDSPQCAVCDTTISVIGDPSIFDEHSDIYCEQHKPLE